MPTRKICLLDNRAKQLISLRARTDCFGAYGPSASLTLGSPCGRPPSPLRGAVVELVLFVCREFEH
jgi:hypothetical protein